MVFFIKKGNSEINPTKLCLRQLTTVNSVWSTIRFVWPSNTIQWTRQKLLVVAAQAKSGQINDRFEKLKFPWYFLSVIFYTSSSQASDWWWSSFQNRQQAGGRVHMAAMCTCCRGGWWGRGRTRPRRHHRLLGGPWARGGCSNTGRAPHPPHTPSKPPLLPSSCTSAPSPSARASHTNTRRGSHFSMCSAVVRTRISRAVAAKRWWWSLDLKLNWVPEGRGGVAPDTEKELMSTQPTVPW